MRMLSECHDGDKEQVDKLKFSGWFTDKNTFRNKNMFLFRKNIIRVRGKVSRLRGSFL